MGKSFIVILFILSRSVAMYGQTLSGTVFEKNGETPIAFVNIGISGKNRGTVSDQNGRYTLHLSPEYQNDTIIFSCIGYHPFAVKVSELLSRNNGDVILEARQYELSEVVVRPKKIRKKTLGITTRSRFVVECFADSVKGSEAGTIMKNKNTVFVNAIDFNIANCSYDTVYFRMNIYRAKANMQFENILNSPVYVSFSKEEAKKKITVDLRHLNLFITGDFLVTIETVKDLGPGKLCFYGCNFYKSYRRNASQGVWGTIPTGLSISALVDIER